MRKNIILTLFAVAIIAAITLKVVTHDFAWFTEPGIAAPSPSSLQVLLAMPDGTTMVAPDTFTIYSDGRGWNKEGMNGAGHDAEHYDPTAEMRLDLSTDVPCRNWKYIVLHHSGSNQSTIEGIYDWHVRCKGWEAIGYHFIVMRSGAIYIGERWNQQMQGAHCKGPRNEDGIGVCLIGNFDIALPSDAQVRSACHLIEELQINLQIDSTHVIDHRDEGATACPGKMFSAKSLLRASAMPRMPMAHIEQ
jgi:N-acetylmuramoyl-L-alanine amidase